MLLTVLYIDIAFKEGVDTLFKDKRGKRGKHYMSSFVIF